MTNPMPLELENQIRAYEKYLFDPDPGQVWDSAGLEAEVLKHFDVRGPHVNNTEPLFTRFADIWARYYYQLRDYTEADKCWDVLLGYVTRWEEDNQQKHIHKASAYYYRGMAAIAAGNIDRGFLFFHQAVDEDNKFPHQRGWGPAWSFATFNFSDPNQRARPLLIPRAKWLEGIISEYRSSSRGSLTLAKLRKRVLAKKRLKETTFSFTHAVFRSESLLSLPKEFRSSAFASQLELDILFSLCRIGEVWLKQKQRPTGNRRTDSYERQLRGQLVRFFENPSINQSIHVNEQELTEVGQADFGKCLRALLDNKKGSFPRRFQPLESDLLLILKMRNQAGHETKSSDVVSARFEELLERVFFGLFKIVETLFRS